MFWSTIVQVFILSAIAVCSGASRRSLRRVGLLGSFSGDQGSLQSDTDHLLDRGFVHPRYRQVFDISRSGNGQFDTYNASLVKFVAGNKDVEIDRDLNILVIPKKATMHSRLKVRIGNNTFYLVQRHTVGANPLGHSTWRIVPKGNESHVLFTIQRKRLALSQRCRCVKKRNCKITWTIYQGRRKEKKPLLRGIADDTGKDNIHYWFYGNKKKADDKVGEAGDGFKVTAFAGQDAALMIVSFIGMYQDEYDC